MPACPAGHDSATSDYCDVCGAPLAVAATSAPRPASAAAGGGSAVPQAQRACPGCGFPQVGRFCEGCGYDFATGTRPAGAEPASAEPASAEPAGADPAGADRAGADPAGAGLAAAEADPAEAGWTAVVTADRDHFDATVARGGLDAGDLSFPPYCPERSFPLSGEQIRIGRRSVSRGLAPEIDLTGPPLDPGVSHLQVLLLRRPDGSWQVVDPGSANGTLINDAANPIGTNVPVPVSDGDRIHVGAWTTITLRQRDSQ
jgi:FHA domain